MKRAGPEAAKLATCGNDTVAFVPSGLRPVGEAPFAICDPAALPTVGVGHPASQTTRPSSAFSGTSTFGFAPSFQSRVVGVGHPAPVASVPDVRCADAR